MMASKKIDCITYMTLIKIYPTNRLIIRTLTVLINPLLPSSSNYYSALLLAVHKIFSDRIKIINPVNVATAEAIKAADTLSSREVIFLSDRKLFVQVLTVFTKIPIVSPKPTKFMTAKQMMMAIARANWMIEKIKRTIRIFGLAVRGVSYVCSVFILTQNK